MRVIVRDRLAPVVTTEVTYLVGSSEAPDWGRTRADNAMSFVANGDDRGPPRAPGPGS